MNRLIVINIPQIVKKRKYEVDINKLQKLLRERKKAKQLTNKDISKLLEIPRTMAEHYFRTDKYFDIPDSDNWQKTPTNFVQMAEFIVGVVLLQL